MTNLVANVREAVREHPDATAISVHGSETSYAEFWALTGRFAGALRERGVGSGDRIAVYLPNLPQFVVAYYGILRVGGVVVPMDPAYEADEIKPILGNSTSGAIVTTNSRVPEIEQIHEHTLLQFIVTADGPGEYSTGFTEFLRESPEVDYWSVAPREDDDVAVLVYTDGSTGKPKGVLLTHENLASNAAAVANLPAGGLGPDDAALGALALTHTYGMTVTMNAVLSSGASVTPMRSWDAGDALARIDEQALTFLAGTPKMYDEMAADSAAGEHTLSSVRLALSGGSPLSSSVREAFESAFEPTIHEGYGLTEASPVTHVNHPDRDRRVGSIGQPIDGVTARVVNGSFETVDPVTEAPVDDGDLDSVTGELVVAGPNVMKQYHEQNEVNAAAFTGFDGERWLHTGDLVYYDEDDYCYFVDRKADVFEAGETTVYPRTVETLLAEHDAVAACAVVEAAGDEGESVAVAFVVRADGHDVDADDLQEYWLETDRDASYPRAVTFESELPRTTTGKLKRHALGERTNSLELTPASRTEVGDAGERSGLQDLDGISESRATMLQEAGYETLTDLRAADRADLSDIEGFGDALADRIKQQVDDET